MVLTRENAELFRSRSPVLAIILPETIILPKPQGERRHEAGEILVLRFLDWDGMTQPGNRPKTVSGIKLDIFATTYEPLPGAAIPNLTFRKKTRVFALELNTGMTVQTKDGPATAFAGDVLVQNENYPTDQYVVRGEAFHGQFILAKD